MSDVQARLAASPLSAGAATGSGTKHRTIVVGIGGDELLPATVRLPSGCVLPVLGGPASGKSSLLAAIPQLNPHVPEWLFPGADDAADNYWAGLRLSADAGALSRDAVLLVDDADMLTPEATRHLMDLHSLGWTVLLTAGFSPTLVQRVPLAAHARGHGNGILIAPRNIMDGDFFGVRFEVDPNPPPGRAVLISAGRATPGTPGGGIQPRRHRAGGAPPAREAKLITLLRNSSTTATAAGTSMAQPRHNVTAGESRKSDRQHKQLGHQRPRPRPAESTEKEIGNGKKPG